MLRVSSHAPDLMDELVNRFQVGFNKYSQFSSNGFDALDLFYWYERTGVWDSWRLSAPWSSPSRCSWTPFTSRKLRKMACLLPPPLASTRLLPKIIRRFWPSSYWFRINGSRILPIEDFGDYSSLLIKADRKLDAYLGRIRAKLNISKSAVKGDNTDDIRRKALHSLSLTTCDILTSEDSLAR